MKIEIEEAVTPTGDGAGGREWRYVETTLTAKVVAGDVELLPHWSGPARPDEIRAVVRKAAAAPALYEAADLALKYVAADIELLRCETHSYASFCADCESRAEAEALANIVRAALALVDGPQEGLSKNI